MGSDDERDVVPTRVGLAIWMLGPILAVVAIWMLLRADTLLMAGLWVLVLMVGARDSSRLVDHYLG